MKPKRKAVKGWWYEWEDDWIEEPKSAFGMLNKALKGLDNNK